MDYVVGTGRCGTQSLCAHLNLLQEPQPWVPHDIHRKFEWGLDGEIEREAVRDILNERIILAKKEGKRGIADWMMTYYVHLIREVDPEARIIWPLRICSEMVNSYLLRGVHYPGGEAKFPSMARPQGGWPTYYGPKDKCVYHWLWINQELAHFAFTGPEQRCFLIRTKDIPAHKGRTDNSIYEALARTDAHAIDTVYMPWYHNWVQCAMGRGNLLTGEMLREELQ